MTNTFGIIDWNKWFFSELAEYDRSRLPLILWDVDECKGINQIVVTGKTVVPMSIKLSVNLDDYDYEKLGDCELYRQEAFEDIMLHIGNQWRGKTIGICSFNLVPQVVSIDPYHVAGMPIIRVFPISDVVSKYDNVTNGMSMSDNNQVISCTRVQYPATTWRMGANPYELSRHNFQQVWIQTKKVACME